MNSRKGAGAEAPGQQWPRFSGVSSQVGPERSSLAPGALKLTPEPLARGRALVLSPQEGSRRSTFLFSKPRKPGRRGFGFQRL